MLLVGNGRIITRDENNTYIENGIVAIKDNKIIDISEGNELLKKYPNSKFIDANGGLIMPGFINTHNHIYSAFARGLSINGYNPSNFNDILEGMWWKIDSMLNLECIKYSAYATYIDCIKNGVTTVFDHHASYLDIADSLFTIAAAAEELGVRTNLCFEISDRNGEELMHKAVKESVDFINYTEKKTNDMLKAMMGLHASFTVSDKTLNYCNEQKPSNIGYHIHVAEGISDVYDCLKKYNKRIVNRLLDMNVLGDKTIAAHCIHIDKNEMDILKNTNTIVVHNPESNMGNAVGCGAVIDMFKSGIKLGLGTDGYTNDMLESLKVGNLIHKHNLCNPTVAWAEIPYMLFNNNADIANRFLDGQVGKIKNGYYADVIIADYDPLTPMTKENINSHILFGLVGKDVRTTIINGKILMKDHEIIGVDTKRIYAKSRELASQLWEAINKI